MIILFRDEQSLRIIEKVKHISLAIKKKGKSFPSNYTFAKQ